MVEDFNNTMASIATKLRDTARDARVGAFLSIHWASDIMDMRMNMGLKKYDINQTRLGILYMLVTHGGIMTPTELSRVVVRTKQAITFAVDGLEKQGLVTRKLTDDDRRTKRIQITQKGLELAKVTMADRQELILDIMSSLEQEEVEQLSATLTKLRKSLRQRMENSSSR